MVYYGESPVNVPTVVPDEGYTFRGQWTASVGGTYTTEDLETYIVTGGVTFTAVIIPNVALPTFGTLTFNPNGGADAPAPLTVANDTIITLTNMTAEPPADKFFVGWSARASGGSIMETIVISGDEVIYAQYEDIPEGGTFSVTFRHGDHGAFDFVENPLTRQTISAGDAVSEVPEIIANEGYTFLGWQLDGEIFPAAAVIRIPVRSDTEYTAVYEENTAIRVSYTLSFDADIGSNAPDELILAEGTTLSVLAFTADAPSGYAFIGWRDEVGTSVTAVTMDDNHTLTAGYVLLTAAGPFTVTFSTGSNGTMTPSAYSESVTGGASVSSVPAITAKSRYTFLGWSMNGGDSYYSTADVLAMPIVRETEFEARYQETSVSSGGGGGGGGGSEPAAATLIIRAVDADSGSNLYEQTITAVSGARETITAPFIDGYELADGETSAREVQILPGRVLVVFNYVLTGKRARSLYITGYSDGTLKPQLEITRAEAATIFWRLLQDEGKAAAVENAFSDVPQTGEDGWYVQQVNYLTKIGVLTGYPDGMFRPSAKITRAELSAIVSRFAEVTVSTANVFSDIGGHWAYDNIQTAAANGWLAGYPDGTFKPEQNITRAETVVIINRMLGREPTESSMLRAIDLGLIYSDIAGHWAWADLAAASVEYEYVIDADGSERMIEVRGYVDAILPESYWLHGLEDWGFTIMR
jgi:hypothetical protein